MKKNTQEQQVIEALRSQGGFATLRRLNEVIDFSTWKTLTPEASVRRIVQQSNSIFKIERGLWALEEERTKVLERLQIQKDDPQSNERFTHSYYQGLLVEIGRFHHALTYVPAQDKRHLFLDKQLGQVSDTTILPAFTYEQILRKAKSVDVIWFNERKMPTHFYEVEHTTDIKNSLSKFFELQDFFCTFYIVADECREGEFRDKINASIFSPIRKRVIFLSYKKVVDFHTNLSQQRSCRW